MISRNNTEAIRAEIQRRKAAGEPLAYRQIRAVTGGSNSTIQRCISEASAPAPASSLPLQAPQYNTVARPSEHPIPAEMGQAIMAVLQMNQSMGQLSSLPQAMQDAIEQLLHAQDRTDQVYRRLMIEIDTFRTATVARTERPEALPSPPQTTPQANPLPSPSPIEASLQKQVRSLTAANTLLSERVERLVRQLHEAGIDPKH